jgi:acyl CoA:acetate/3-ketoacid CoA transferase beta subunit
MGYHEQTKRMLVLSLHPGVTLERVRASTGFELGAVAPLPETPRPTEHELDLLRREVDPLGFVLGR